MRNKILFGIVVLLVPFVVISFKEDKTNFYLEEKIEEEKSISVKVKDTNTNEIIKMNLEDYLVGVVAAEMPASFHEEALKAQAVAARSYALYKINNSNKEYDLVTNVTNQSYITQEEMKNKWNNDFDKYFEKISKAVNDTKNEVMYYDNEVIEAFYFSMSNGYTEEASLVFKETEPYLTSVESSWDNESLNGFTKEVIFTKDEFCKMLNLSCENLTVNDIERSSSNRVNKIIINNMEFIGTDLRKKLDLRSTDFNITISSDNVVITTYGYGHGVGMSQYGANGMAKEGYNYKDILKHYYTGINISKI